MIGDTYTLRCLGDNTLLEDKWYDKGYLLENPTYDGDALLRSEYHNPLIIDESCKSIFKYSWLPIHESFECSSCPVTFKSDAFASYLGLENLFICYSGYAPEIGALNITGSFKEFEAVGVLGRHGMDVDRQSTLVLASAGNTGRAFAQLAIGHKIKVIIVVAEAHLKSIWTSKEVTENIKLLCVPKGDYSDAINIANKITKMDGFISEGGVKNVGRRDGMACTFISAVNAMERIPDHYFQAVGSGSGAISAWETSMRFKSLMDTPGPELPRLHISQNIPFTPLIDAWDRNTRVFKELDYKETLKKISKIQAHVLANRKPPYSIIGGMYDALQATKGLGYRVTNEALQSAGHLFFQKEGLELEPSASVACASLIHAVKHEHIIKPKDYVMLNLTGGGYSKIKEHFNVKELQSHATVPSSISQEELHACISEL